MSVRERKLSEKILGAAVAQSIGTWLGDRRVVGSSHHMDQVLTVNW